MSLNPYIQQRLAPKIKMVRDSHSAQWMGTDVMEDMIRKVEVGSIEYIERLRLVQQGVGNFVRIVTGRDIPVVYSSGQQSYTNGESIVISADMDPTKLDSMVGTALHEAAHCLLSTSSLAFLKVMATRFEQLIAATELPRLAAQLNIPLTRPAPAGGRPGVVPAPVPTHGQTVYDHVHAVMNVLEDRRIDLWMYQNASGYRPYYESMYSEYWHSDRIDQALADPMFRDAAVMNYILHVVNMTNTNFDVRAMPGLDEIRKIANYSAAGLEARGNSDPGWKSYQHALASGDRTKYPKLFNDACRIVEIMYSHSKSVESQAPDSGGQDMQPGDGGNGNGKMGNDLPNMDQGNGTPVTIKIDPTKTLKEVSEALDKQLKFLGHELPKAKLDAAAQALLDQANETKAKIVDVQGDFLPRGVKAKVIVYRNVTPQIVRQPTFPFRYNSRYSNTRSANMTNPAMITALKSGIRMGQVLAHRIRILADESPLTYNRQKNGRLDKRRVAALGTGAADVFSYTIIEKKKPANLWLDIDFSGSMEGDASTYAMAVAIAIAYAAEKNRMLNVTIAIRDGGDNAARVAILYNSRKDRFDKLRKIVPYIGVQGGTPESLCFEAIKDEMIQMFRDERKFFINLSDGEPQHSFNYNGRHYTYGHIAAQKHCRMMMNEFRNVGIDVMSYYISNAPSGGVGHAGFRSMYGKDARFINPTQITGIINTLNKLLLS